MLATTLTIRDETTFRRATTPVVWILPVPKKRMTVRELIQARVYREVEEYNAQQPETFRGLVQPSDAERALNGFKLPKGRSINAEAQFQNALRAFQSNGFILLVDDRQVDDLDEVVEIGAQTSLTFLKLVPLVGG
jgi:hypothetical protein